MARNKRSLLADAATQYPSKRSRLSQGTDDEDGYQEINDEPASTPSPREHLSPASLTSPTPTRRRHGAGSPSPRSISESSRASSIQIPRSDEEAQARLAQVQRDRQNTANQAAENAIIEEVICTNFMCHASLHITLGPLINFIIGHNGSGKSAILTALIICLGGKASATNRGQSLKQFIKEGTEKCTIRVRIKNMGRSAYKHDIYGDSIVVERHFARSGSSGFNLRTATGKSVSTARGDVDDLLDYFALQLDNPMNVLTQDQARAFLTASSAKEKYKFFSKGTQLEQLDSDYANIEETMTKIEANIEVIKSQAEDAKRRYETAKKDAEATQYQQQLREHIEKVRYQICWVQVYAQEKVMLQKQSAIDDSETLLAQHREAFDQLTRDHAQLQLRKESVEDSMQKLTEQEIQPLQQQKQALVDDFQTHKTDLYELITEQRNLKSEFDATESSMKSLTKEVEKEQQKLENLSSTVSEINSRLKNAQTELLQIQTNMEGEDARETCLRHEMEPLKVANNAAQDEVRKQEQRVDDCKRQIATTREQAGQSHRPPELRKVLDDINRASWREKPVGPVSDFVFLKEPKWSSILERQFGSALNAFIVTNKEDSSKLLALIKRHSLRNTSVLIGNGRPIVANEPPHHFLTWMRALNIKSDLVRNQLIIHQGIEKTVLIESREKANEILDEGHRNIRQVFCFADNQQGDKRGSGFRLFKSDTKSSVDPIKAYGRDPRREPIRMKMDTEARLNLERENLRHEELRLSELTSTYRTANDAWNNTSKAHHNVQRMIHGMRVKRDKLDENVKRIQDELDEATPQNGKIDAIKSELETKMRVKTVQMNALEDLEVEKQQKNIVGRELKQKIEQLDQDMALIKGKIDDLAKKSRRMQEQTQDKLHEKNQTDSRIRQCDLQKQDLVQDLEQQKQSLDSIISMAREFYPDRIDVPDTETLESLDLKYERLNADLQDMQQKAGGSEEELKERELQTKLQYDERETKLNMLKRILQVFKHALSKRRERWLKFRDYIACSAESMFIYLLSERQFRGKLRFRHDRKELEIKVEPDSTRSNDSGRQTKTLSGGEKSFSTICLLLSLWDAMGSPIRCLDEFDVFMDNVNRDISVRMLIDAARSQASRQFILISPQSMSRIQIQSDIKIHKMQDPERGPMDRYVGNGNRTS